MQDPGTSSWRERAKRQVAQLRLFAVEARAAAQAARAESPRLAQELFLKAHNLEVTANGIARNLDARASPMAS